MRATAAETRPVQKIISRRRGAGVFALLVVSALDHRFGWSNGADAGRLRSATCWWWSALASPCSWSSRTAMPPRISRSRRIRKWCRPDCTALCAIRCTSGAHHDDRHPACARLVLGTRHGRSLACAFRDAHRRRGEGAYGRSSSATANTPEKVHSPVGALRLVRRANMKISLPRLAVSVPSSASSSFAADGVLACRHVRLLAGLGVHRGVRHRYAAPQHLSGRAQSRGPTHDACRRAPARRPEPCRRSSSPSRSSRWER